MDPAESCTCATSNGIVPCPFCESLTEQEEKLYVEQGAKAVKTLRERIAADALHQCERCNFWVEFLIECRSGFICEGCDDYLRGDDL